MSLHEALGVAIEKGLMPCAYLIDDETMIEYLPISRTWRIVQGLRVLGKDFCWYNVYGSTFENKCHATLAEAYDTWERYQAGLAEVKRNNEVLCQTNS